MEYHDIIEDMKVDSGEYLYYEPEQKVVLCGRFSRENNLVSAMMDGKYIEDSIDKFKKIMLTRKEHQERKISRCKGCGSG